LRELTPAWFREVQVKRVVRFLIMLAVIAASLAIPGEASAQRRVVRRPAPRSVVYVSARPYYRPYYYAPAFGFGGYAGWYNWYGSPWHGYGYPYYAQYPYPYGRYYRDYTSSARLEVKPREAEVFIDGYFVGTVDDYDGWLQRLHIEPGEHELVIYLKGHRTFRQNVLFRPGATLKVEHIMQPLAAGDTEEPRPVPDRTAGRGPVRRDPQDYPPPDATIRASPAIPSRRPAAAHPNRNAASPTSMARSPCAYSRSTRRCSWTVSRGSHPPRGASRCSCRRARTASRCARKATGPIPPKCGSGAGSRHR
jgi:hypothetical protein